MVFAVSAVLIEKAVGRPPLLLGRTPAAGIALSRRSLGRACGLGRALRYRADILAQQARRIGVAAPLGEAQHLQDPHRTVERDGDDIAGLYGPARCGDALAIEPHMALCHERRRRRARAHNARVPQPFVDALAVGQLTLSYLTGARMRPSTSF